MKPELYEVEVIFRKYKDSGDIFAIFPYEIATQSLDVTCYETVGQHSSGSYGVCMHISVPAKPSEYTKLALELKSLGYVLNIKRRANSKKQSEAYQLAMYRGAK